jgi:hypothetical protein
MGEENLYLLMENSLFNNLKPVTPDPQFIQKLGSRLLGTKNMRIEDPNRSMAFVIMSLGLFLGVLLVWLFRKGN